MRPSEARYLSMAQITHFYRPMGEFPELQSAREDLTAHPEKLLKMYAGYRQVVKRMANLGADDTAILMQIQDEFPNHRGVLHFIEKYGAERMPGLKTELDRAVFPDAPTYPAAADDLLTRMRSAQVITDNPHDAPGTENMIYGYRVIREQKGYRHSHEDYTEAQEHFVFCHFLERALFQSVKPGLPGADWKKDDFLGAMGDIIILDNEYRRRLGEHHDQSPLFRIWARNKDNGGLGWLKFEYANIAFNYMHAKRIEEADRRRPII